VHIGIANVQDRLQKDKRIDIRMITRLTIAMFAMLVGAISPASAAPLLQMIGAPLAHPWGMDFLDDSSLLVTERGGNMYKISLNDGHRQPITNLPDVEAKRQGGLLDVAVSKNDPAPHTIFLCYSRPIAGGSVTAIDRAQLDGTRLTNRKSIFIANNTSSSAMHYGCRLALHNGYIYASLGERGQRHDAQDPALHAGAIIRLHEDGTIPDDNPKPAGWAPEIISKGHRNPQGLAIHPQTGQLWAHEHGPRGGDEINIITPGQNYGWPTVSHGKEYIGGTIGIGTSAPNLVDPVWVWTPSIAPSGMAFYDGPMFPQLNGQLLVGSLKFERLYLVQLENGLPKDEYIIFEDTIGRVRDVAVAADGSILLLSDEEDGGLFRLTEAGS
jgi:glucose/arabinose dehydrogenase